MGNQEVARQSGERLGDFLSSFNRGEGQEKAEMKSLKRENPDADDQEDEPEPKKRRRSSRRS